MQQLNIIFISSLLIVGNNFGMDRNKIIANEIARKFTNYTRPKWALSISDGPNDSNHKGGSNNLSIENNKQSSTKKSRKFFGATNGQKGNVTSNIERRFTQLAISEWAQSLSGDSNRKRRLHQNPVEMTLYFSLFDSNGGERVINISTDSFEYVIFKQMLNDGTFNPNIRDNGDPLLHLLIKQTKDYTKIRDVLRSGVSINEVDEKGKTALSYAVILNDQKLIDMLLQYGAVVHTNMLVGRNLFLGKIFCLQQCYSCKKHPENMSNIPCINQHTGMYLCKDCYNKSNAKCPLCRRSLDEYGK